MQYGYPVDVWDDTTEVNKVAKPANIVGRKYFGS
jgi:hypothetical protein